MGSLLLHWIISAFVLMGTAYLLPGFVVSGFGSALIASVIIACANVLIRPILLLVTLPINILTLGLFTWVINALILKICAAIAPGFEVKTWGAAFLGALVMALLSMLAYWLIYPAPPV